MLEVSLFRNDEELDLTVSSSVTVLDSDFIRLSFLKKFDEKVEVYLEDYSLPLIFSETENLFSSISDKIFRESFGYSHLRFFLDGDMVFEIIFNVLTYSDKFEQIKLMVSYLLNNNERILDICFSRTKINMSNSRDSNANFETLIASAENIIDNFIKRKSTLSSVLRSHLLPVKEDLNDSNVNNINPFDVLENIEDLIPSNSIDSIRIKNKLYSLDNIKRENYLETYDLIENKILLGGVISIKNALDEMLLLIEGNANLTFDKEYKNLKSFQNKYSIDDLYLQLTTSGMKRRIERLLSSIPIILFEIQKKLKVEFSGYIHPKVTPFVRNSSFYLTVFDDLYDWYSLGSPKLGVDHTLTKIRSTSKIYELFCLYKLVEKFVEFGWDVFNSTEHSFFKNFIPSHVDFKKDNITISLYYEKLVLAVNSNSKNNDLVYLKHHRNMSYSFYTPDFIIKKENENSDVGYYILDSKYSSTTTLAKYDVLNELFRKYHTNLAVYDSKNKTLSADKILSINALHPFGDKEISKWHQTEFARISPDVSTIKVSSFENDLNRILSLIEVS